MTDQSKIQGNVMARKKTIGNDQILDAAEQVLLRDGVHRFTLDAVAAEAGISKGGLVYSFPSKDLLIMTMLSRELARFEQEAQQQTARYANQPYADVLGHIAAIGQEEDETTSRAVGLLTALVHSPAMLEPVREFYRIRLDRLRDTTPTMQRIRLAFLATEGVFLLQGLGFVTLDHEERQTMIDDAKSLFQSDDNADTLTAYTTADHRVTSSAPPTAYSQETPSIPAGETISEQAIVWLAEKGVAPSGTGLEAVHSRAAHIVETATNIIKRDGISALTHRAVANEAHIPLGSTTYHFNSLDDMLNAVMRSAIALFRDDMFSWFHQRRHDDPRDVLTDFVMRGIEDIDDLAREYELFTAAISRPSLRPIALEWSNTVVAIIKVVTPDSAALPLSTLMNGFFIRALLEKHERTLPRDLVYQSVSALYNAFR
ncbi:TetR family transcriptional regulator [Pectobacterium aroidearum]|uniref:TetR family transcriptional regulator n=1 Tax=Pectobacterium aroidearum TaxID=1201031 RepID=UPI002113D20E|nr:TetR family transcriptional regulator [Pectobacterium aroidearum]UUE43645.1 TetR family transcriptional regulator [Pectobacterium aroidearum]UUE47864.1 TetR family transcriptional regulator [Pectobacterium aroidearum]UUE52069.1 TetR family transcriptional regulator [Pectobacterium aroidearum]UUE60479.1 TetR family transcriptional regulator [Pectobacterium aroidearum]UUE64702.1 TetR family transcriptional regulator [Pectobacterium aroidearum]